MVEIDPEYAPTLTPPPNVQLPAADPSSVLPERIGRYRIEKVLGKGGFGLVYLAYDEQLGRKVAIKVAHFHLISQLDDPELYLNEARTVANLDHPHIVPVHDVGSTVEFPVFVVSKYVEGCDLAAKIKQSRLSHCQAAELAATIAEALHYAHKQGLVHRDVKPGNILIDNEGKAFVVDFGLALREENIGKGANYLGTPAYMSPEQARGEGHRVDGRSDIFSLGVVLYELLLGRRPFRGDSQAELMDSIISHEPRPLRQYDDKIPKELERICLKALCKRASERYLTAHDFADDLRHFLSTVPQVADQFPSPAAPHSGNQANSQTAVSSNTPSTIPVSDSRPIKIVPKGLRSFDAHDADFFLELLPGPRDRDGFPNSIRFWKTRLEGTDPDEAFAVGLIYGPSGCGKSSLMKAGLLPVLSKHVIAVYVEATPHETETKLLHGIRKHCPTLPDNLNLTDTLAALRRGQSLPAGKKVLIVLDQFEQWLHAKKEQQNTELVQALRQCDGGRLQCIVMVRDDFWLAVSRFLQELEIRLLEGHNSAMVDLFDIDHAKKVLAAFGRAFGKLPPNSHETNKDQKEFVNQAVNGLAQEGKVISVRLALLAEMLKGKAWTPATLKGVGGTEGVGVTFLEETFSATTATPEHRYHQKAARAVLNSLLPESGSDIKGNMRSHAELLEASGYDNRPADFENLIQILNSEIRLITPTDPEGNDVADASSIRAGAKYYQLTHDYLVPALREWLTRKQKQTRRGRAELLLVERSTIWNAKTENRDLPTALEFARILLFTARQRWTGGQRRMMRRAARVHWQRAGALAVVFVALLLISVTVRGWVIEEQNRKQAEGRVKELIHADFAQVPTIVDELGPYRAWANPLLVTATNDHVADSPERLKVALALLPVDNGQVDYLRQRLLTSDPTTLPVIRDLLLRFSPNPTPDLVQPLWQVLTDESAAPGPRFQAACALATIDREGLEIRRDDWRKVGSFIADRFVATVLQDLGHFVSVLNALRPARSCLLTPLSAIFRDPHRTESERSMATNVLCDYASDQPGLLVELLLNAEPGFYQNLFAVLSRDENQAAACQFLAEEVARPLPEDPTDPLSEAAGKQRANAALGLLKLHRPQQFWPMLKHSADPRIRSYIIQRFAAVGAPPGIVLEHLNNHELEGSIRRALLLILGTFRPNQFSDAERDHVISEVSQLYRNNPDPGLHGASAWLLKQWDQESLFHKIDQELATGTVVKNRNWYVNGQGQTMTVIIGPVEFVRGSPATEEGREGGRDGKSESQHRKRIDRTFSIAAREVTVEQFRRFRPTHVVNEQYAPTLACPVNRVSWYDAAAYCNWLSAQEHIKEDQWCYLANDAGEFADGMKLAPNYLHRTGYRLPSEAEWEFACRAGAVTSRYYGQTEELLRYYGRYVRDPREPWTLPVGSLQPNDLGLFDMLGNVWEWCQDGYVNHQTEIDDLEDANNPKDNAGRTLRGGSIYRVLSVRCADRDKEQPAMRDNYVGLRPVRTQP